ncbi:hypothetical protein ACGC1H_002167 [Rhizoctonia solani]
MLSVALERYSAACLAIQNSYARGKKPHTIDPQVLPRLDAEIDLAISLQSKLAGAKAAKSWSRNCAHTHATVNDIPSEVLAYIFHLVVRSQPCAKMDCREVDKEVDPMYPAVLSRVCSRWRSIALSTPTLWTHIDISTSTLLNKQHLDCLTKLHLSHAGQLSLNVHIFNARGYEISQLPHGRGIDSTILGSITWLAGRTSSFNIDELSNVNPYRLSRILSNIFQDSTPGTLTCLTISMSPINFHHAMRFLKANDDPDSNGWIMDLPKEQLESVLSRVSVLRLAGPYLTWTSRAYHGLVELRLVRREVINESVLVGILHSSPGLRILQLNLQIDSLVSIDAQVTPVVLRDLEVLILWQITGTLLPSLLRWLAPGPKPLQFGFEVQDEMYMPNSRDIGLKADSSVSFLLRSRLKIVYGVYMGIISAIELLELSPGIKELAISYTTFDVFPSHDAVVRSTFECHLTYFQISYSSVHIEAVLAFLSHLTPTFIIGVVVFHDCRFFRHYVQILDDQVSVYVEELKASYPDVRFIVQSREEPHLVHVESWGPSAFSE